MLYYQGFGHLFLGRVEDALLHFDLALEVGGPWDDQLLYESMRQHAGRGDAHRENQAFRRLDREFSESAFGSRARAFRAMRWHRETGGMVWGGVAYTLGDLPYEGPKARLLGEWLLGAVKEGGKAAGKVGFSGRASLDGRSDQEFAAEAGLELGWQGLSMSLDGGPTYSAYPDSLGTYAPAGGKWEWQVSGRLDREFRPASWARLQGEADFLALGSAFRVGGGGMRLEFQGPGKPFASARLEGSRVPSIACASDPFLECDGGRAYGYAVAGGGSWRPSFQSVTVSAIWRQDRDADTGEREREAQSAEIRYWRRLPGSWSLSARVEGGRKDRGGGWEPLLRSSLDCALGW
jgi:hypothetical protein